MIRYRCSFSVPQMCDWTGMAKSTYYYQPKDNRPGRKPSTHTCTHDGELVSNEVVVREILNVLETEFMDSYGYEYVSVELQRSFMINHKKVYRLMNENNLLLACRSSEVSA